MTIKDSSDTFQPDPVSQDGNFLISTAQADGQITWSRQHGPTGETLCDYDLRPLRNFASEAPEICSQCQKALTPWSDRISIRRTCADCHKPHYIVSTDSQENPYMSKGDEFVIPVAIFRSNMSLTRGASFTQRGVDWLAKTLFPYPLGLNPNTEQISSGLLALADEAGQLLDKCVLLDGIDRHSDEGASLALDILTKHPTDPGLMALLVEQQSLILEQLLSEASDGVLASVVANTWSAASAAALMRFKTAFEEAAYQGHSFEKIRWLNSKWLENKDNSSEQFWQDLLLENPFALSQLFAAPVVIHGERFLLGGVRAGGKHGKIADYLLRNQLTDAAIIVEIKTPCKALLLENEYRQDVFIPSRDLSGAVQQVLEQRAQFMKSMSTLQAEQEEDEPRVEVIEPHCVVIIGNTDTLTTRAQRRSFETYRIELRNVRVVTFDELFAKLNNLAGLLNLEDIQANNTNYVKD